MPKYSEAAVIAENDNADTASLSYEIDSIEI